MNTQRPVRQIWLAGGDRAWHFDWNASTEQWLDDKGSGAASPASSAASVAQLRGIPAETGHPLYWAGRRSEFTYELTRTADGNVYVRYLPPGIPVGAREPNYLTIGTYPRPRALRALRGLAAGTPVCRSA